ncbi:MAG TPA: DsbA family protein [Gemmatimonadaceae bacterium]
MAFHTGNTDTTSVAAIDRDSSTALRIGGTGTPTFVVNGWRFTRVIDSATVDSVVHAVARH